MNYLYMKIIVIYLQTSLINYVMKKLIPLLLVLLSLCCCTKENHPTQFDESSSSYFLSETDAIKEVEGFLASMPETKSTSLPIRRKIESTWIPTARTKSSYDESDIYVFNFADSLGFAIVSSDPKIGILGVSTQGTLNEDSDVSNSSLSVILSRIETLYEYPDTSERPHIITHEYGEWTDHVYAPTNGYCPVKWGRNLPYCNYCRTTDGTVSIACCVSIAIAQLMSMYKYPSSYQSYTFDWDRMIATPYAMDYDTEEQYVARLVQLLGTSENLDVDYLGTSAWAHSQNIPHTLENFGFSSGGTYSLYNSSYAILELQMGYPILLAGFDTKKTTKHKNIFGHVTSTEIEYEGGHQWLGHGLLTRTRNYYTYDDGILINTTIDTNQYILCNFGENGNYDGYYSELIFNLNIGPSFPDPVETRSTSVNYEGQDGYYRYCIDMVTGIRQ